MGQWWILLLVASQAALQPSAVDATFNIGLGWLRGDNFFIEFVHENITTEAPLSALQDAVNTTVTGDALNGRRTNLSITTTTSTMTTPVDATQFVDPTTTTEVPPQESRSEPASSPATTGTTAGTTPPTTTPLPIVNATRVSLDDLALEIAKVQDPLLHMVQNEDGSSSYVVLSGRLGPTVTTTEATTAAPTTAPTIGTTSPPPRNATSVSYETLLSFFRPWLFGGLFPAPTKSPVTTPGPSTPTARTPGPATASTTAARMLTRADLDVTAPSATTPDTGTPLATHLTEDPTTTTLFPAEFRETGFEADFALTEATAFTGSSNATVAGTDIHSTVQPAAQPTAADKATPAATDAAPTPRTTSTRGAFMETSTAFPVPTTTTSSADGTPRGGPADVTITATPATTARMSSQSDRTTATLVTTLQPPVGDLREDTVVPSTTTAAPASLPTFNETSGGYVQPSWATARTTAEEPAYRFYYDARDVAL